MIDFDLLKVICETPGAPGFEKPIRDLVIRLVKPMVDELSVDAMGNVGFQTAYVGVNERSYFWADCGHGCCVAVAG